MNKLDVIGRGFFPKELPPPFNTKQFATLVGQSNYASQQSKYKSAKCYSYSYIRYGSLRRRISIPHPYFYTKLCEEMGQGWPDIQIALSRSSISQSTPTISPVRSQERRPIHPSVDFAELPAIRAKHRSTGRYVLLADVSMFYQSIYTHSIPWALHTKTVAKQRKRDTRLLGNRLDKFVRSSQDGQTIGLPVGPDTSLVLSELIMCSIDNDLHQRISSHSGNIHGFRYSDNYEFVFNTFSDAEFCLNQIQQLLGQFELSINPLKTGINELPHSIGSSWVLDLSSYSISEGNRYQQMQDLIRYFDRAFALAIQYQEDPILKYAIARFSRATMTIMGDNRELLDSLLLQAITIDPSTLQDALAIISTARRTTPITALLHEVINIFIDRHAQLDHSSEVAWSIWCAIVLNLTIEPFAAKQMSSMEDSIVAILALDARRRGLIPQGLDTSQWEKYLTQDELYDEQWILCYEANAQNLLSGPGSIDHVLADPWFAQLKRAGVRFYDQQTPLVIPHTHTSGPSGYLSAARPIGGI